MGVEKEMPFHLKNKIKATNKISLFFSLIFLGNMLADYKSDLDTDAPWSVVACAIFLFLPFLNKKGFIYASRSILQLVFNLSTVLYLGVFGRGYGFQSFFLAAAVLPFYLYSYEERKRIFLWTFLPIFLSSTCEFTNFSIHPVANISSLPSWFSYYIFVMARTFLLAVVYQMFQYEKNSEKKNKILRSSRERRIGSKAFRNAA
jgi:hypothetical protein